MIEFFTPIIEFFTSIFDSIDDTSRALYSIEFNDNPVLTYIGYFRYAVGDVNYVLFTSLLLIAVGISLFTFFVKGFHWIRQFLPI